LEYGIQAVPVLAVIKNGKLANKLVGLQDIDVIRKWVKSNIE
jgi:thioredoxin-like negative regulator of GroEL